MDISTLRDFAVLAETQNFTKAALKVNTSQSNLSKRVTLLESELGFKLFERSTRSVSLTDAGVLFYQGVLEMLQRFDETVRGARELSAGSMPAVTVGGNFANSKILTIAETAAAQSITRNMPFRMKIDSAFVLSDPLVADYIEPIDAILENRDDIFITFACSELYTLDREIVPLYRDPFAVFIASDHGYGNGQSVKLAQLSAFNFIKPVAYSTYNARIEEVCNELGFEPALRPRYYGNMADMAEQCGDDEVMIVPASVAYRIPGPNVSGMVRVLPVEHNAFFEVVAVCRKSESAEDAERIAQACSLVRAVVRERFSDESSS